MKRIVIATGLVLVLGGLQAQNFLKPEWRFQTGDDPAWAGEEFDDSGWESMRSGLDWENQGYPTYDGYAWYRQVVVIPADMEDMARETGGMILYLGTIDDCDEAYFNGIRIGSAGSFPPEYETGYHSKREYRIETALVHWGGENTVAVRVYDGGGGGGIVHGKIALSVIGMDELVSLKPVLEPGDHIFRDKGPVTIGIELENRLKQNLGGTMKIRVESDFGEEITTQREEFKLKSGKAGGFSFDLEEPDPGFYNVSVELESSMDNKQMDFAFGVRPGEIDSPTDREADFEDYWMRAKRELAAVSPQFRLIRQEEYCTETREVFLLEMRSLGNVLIRGWYGRPLKPGRYPAILKVQGYSSVQIPEYLYGGDDMVSLALNVRGHGNSCDHVDPGFQGYILHHVDDREMYIYRGAYMDCIRAVDFLYSREEVDTTRVAVEGASQGGALSFATAALDADRIDLCIPRVPFLSDFRDYFRLVSWPGGEFLKWFQEHPEVPQDDIYRNLSYIDIKNLAPLVRCPVFMSIGLVDRTCPPHINFAAYNQLESPKTCKVFPEAGHSLPNEHYADVEKYIRKHFGLTESGTSSRKPITTN